MAQKFKRCFYVSFISFLVSGLWLLLLPFADFNGGGFAKALAYITGAAVWIGIILGTAFFIKTNLLRRRMENGFRENRQKIINSPLCGALMFFQCCEALIADVMLIASTLAVILFSIFTPGAAVLVTICIVLLYTSFVCHCFLNGKNYKYVLEYKKYLKVKEERMKDGEEENEENDENPENPESEKNKTQGEDCGYES